MNDHIMAEVELNKVTSKLIFVLLLFGGFAKGQEIIPFGSDWEYFHPLDGVDPGLADSDFSTTWHTPNDYDGRAFQRPAPATLGYGGIRLRPIVTDIGEPPLGSRYTAYFRKTITTTEDYERICFEILADDGGVLYVDGELVERLKFLGPDNYFAFATGLNSEDRTSIIYLNGGLKAGEHVIAFSLHNKSAMNSDLGFDLRVEAVAAATPLEFLTWSVENGEVTITGAPGNIAGELIIPPTIEGLPVTRIGDSAFVSNIWDTIVLPESVTEIGDSAFRNCRHLANFEIPAGVTSIGDAAFNLCLSLRNIDIPAGVTTLGDSVFRALDLRSLIIPDTVTEIGPRAFEACDLLTSIDFSENVVSIGEEAFKGCDALTSLQFPDRVSDFGAAAFQDCLGLLSVELGNNVTSLGASAFEGCTSLTSLSIRGGATEIGASAFGGCAELSSATISDATVSIGDLAFRDCRALVGFEMGDDVESIGERAFQSCSKLKEITLGGSVKTIGTRTFSSCGLLEKIVVPDSVEKLGRSAFSLCYFLKEVTLGESVAEIGEGTFLGCIRLESVTFAGAAPSQVGEAAFDEATLEAFVAPEHVESFGGVGAQWNGLTVVLSLPPTLIPITSVELNGSEMKVRFSGEPGVVGWRVMGSLDLKNFGDDLTAESIFTEVSPGEYEVVFELADKPSGYFFRVER